jgi:putative two-component system response regulator
VTTADHPSSAAAAAAAEVRRRALVVDDEPTVRSALARYLRRRGWDADEAEDGRAALKQLRRTGPNGYQVVVSDLRMPHCSGVELHDWLAAHRPDLFARLIITTGDLASPTWSSFIARTPRPLIEKPFELAVLAQLIEAVARGR